MTMPMPLTLTLAERDALLYEESQKLLLYDVAIKYGVSYSTVLNGIRRHEKRNGLPRKDHRRLIKQKRLAKVDLPETS